MNTIIDIGGKQFDVKKGDIITIDRLDKDINEIVEFDNIVASKGKDDIVTFGTPFIKDAKVKAKVLEHVRTPKVWVFKFRRRKDHKKLKGHKQPYTMVQIEDIKIA